MIKAIIFDMDGTLINSEKAVIGAFRHVLESHGAVFDEAIIRTHVGRELTDIYTSLVPDADSQELAVLHRDWQIERKHLLQGFEGLHDFLQSLKEKGLKLGAYTSASRLRTEAMLDVADIRNFFEVIVCGDEVTNPKPHEEGVVAAYERIGVKTGEVIMVGDSEHDILSGKNAGAITIGVTHGFGTKKALEEAGADYIAGNLEEIARIIEKLMIDK